MTCGDPQESHSWPLRASPILLPITQRVHADSNSGSELHLSKPDEAAQSRDILARFEMPTHKAPVKPRGYGSGEILSRGLGKILFASRRQASVDNPNGLLKGHPMFLLVLEVFLFIPLQSHD